jgi:hypothetical protein
MKSSLYILACSTIMTRILQSRKSRSSSRIDETFDTVDNLSVSPANVVIHELRQRYIQRAKG